VSANGFEIGTGETGAALHLPPGVPASVAHQLTELAHSVFVSGFIDAMKGTLVVPIAFLALTAASTILIKRRQQPPTAQNAVEREELRAAAG
jgi:hypothetical protein